MEGLLLPTELEDRLRIALTPELELIRPIGAGSTAFAYLARESALDRPVAVKVLRPEYSVDDTARRRFEREARAAARLSHPNVVTVHRVGRLDTGEPYIVMEYIDGRTLADVLAARGPLSLGEARAVIGALASALGAAHDRGIVHRDVRPGNVFIENRTGRAVLSDFGIVALLDVDGARTTRLTAIGQRLGDIRYMSPEQLSGAPVTEQSDVYALGVLAYVALTGQDPFDALTDYDVAAAHLNAQPRPIETLRADIDRGFALIVRRCLDKQPNRRPRAAEMPVLLRAPTQSLPAGAGAFHVFLEELKRRRVYQVAAAYAAVSFFVLQAADLMLPALRLSPRAYNALVVITLAGFPVALVMSWLYDIRDGRLQRTHNLGASAMSTPRRLAWIALFVSVLLSVIVFTMLLR